jgi:hypothetical protein
MENLEIEHEWTGIMGFSVDGQPLIGPVSKFIYISAGYTGNENKNYSKNKIRKQKRRRKNQSK